MKKLTIIIDLSANSQVNLANLYHFSNETPLLEEYCVQNFLRSNLALFLTTNEYRKKNNDLNKKAFLNALTNTQKLTMHPSTEDVNLFFTIPHLNFFPNLILTLKELLGEKYQIYANLIIGRQDIIVEQYSRSSQFYKKWFENFVDPQILETPFPIKKLLIYLEEFLGADNVKVSIESHAQASGNDCPTKAIYEYIDYTENFKMPITKFDFQTKQGRDIWELLVFQLNSWKFEELKELLQEFNTKEVQIAHKGNWDFSYNTSTKTRIKIIELNKDSYTWIFDKYHSEIKVDDFFDSRTIENESLNYDGLTENDLILFLDNISAKAQQFILTYYKHYENLLNDFQKQFYVLLKRKLNINVVSEKHPKALTVLTLSYNHENYIERCIESIQMQNVDFPIQHIILDNKSTDSTREIINKYAQKHDNITPFFVTGVIKHGDLIKTLFNFAKTPYVALCDGDDYFTDPQKLQKQVDFLEKNPSCSLCFHPVMVICEDNFRKPRIFPSEDGLPRGIRPFYYLTELFKGNFIQTNSVVYRWRFQDGIPEWFRGDLTPGDWYWHILHAEQGKIGLINEAMSVYYRHRKSFYSQTEFDDIVTHRLVHGMKELEMVSVLNDYFDNKYFAKLAKLTSRVFASYVKHFVDTQDDSFLNNAAEKYPDFAKVYFNSLPDMSEME